MINGVVNTKVSMDGKAIAMKCRTFFGSGSYVYGRKRDWRQSEYTYITALGYESCRRL